MTKQQTAEESLLLARDWAMSVVQGVIEENQEHPPETLDELRLQVQLVKSSLEIYGSSINLLGELYAEMPDSMGDRYLGVEI